METLPRIILKKGKEKAIVRGHPWVFSGAVAKAEGDLEPGQIVEVFSADKTFLGMGAFNPHSQIILRLLTRKRERLDAFFFRERLLLASRFREEALKGRTNAYRMVNGEGDFLPGLIIDRYGETLVLQSLTAGMERLKGLWVDLLVSHFKPKAIYERSDLPTRKEEGLPETQGLLYGEEMTGVLEIEEHGCRFRVDVQRGQKTGFYLDQRENRWALQRMARGRKVLDCFSYTGGFSIHAGLGGAREVTLIDSSEEVLKRAEDHVLLNRLEKVPFHLIRGDAFDVMRALEPEYELIILDPPPFARKKGHLPGASRGYKELNLQAFRLLKKEGLLFTFTCSHHMDWDLFQRVVFSAALDAGRRVQVLGRKGHPLDHPTDLCHPEGEYLRGLLLRVV